MRRMLCLAVLLAPAPLAMLRGDDKPAAPQPPAAGAPTPEQLIDRLGDRDFRTRENAAKALEGKGSAALAALRKSENHPDAEVRKRVALLVQYIERSEMLAPKRVTLKVEEQPLGDVVESITKQTGYSINFQGSNRGQRVRLALDNVPFWEAMDQVCGLGNLQVQFNDNLGNLYLYNGGTYSPHVQIAGAFRFQANSFNYSKNINFGNLPNNGRMNVSESLSFQFNVQSEPKLPMLGLGQVKLVQAIDDQGNSMLPPRNGAHSSHYYGGGGYRNHNQSAQVSLQWPSKEAKAVKVLRGTVPVTLLGAQKPDVTVENVSKAITKKGEAKKFTGSEAEVSLEEFAENPNKSYTIKLTIQNRSKNAGQDYSWTNSVYQRIELQDEKGNKYQSNGYNWMNSSNTSVQAQFMFSHNGNAKLGPPSKLVYYQWVQVSHQADFEFRNLPLP